MGAGSTPAASTAVVVESRNEKEVIAALAPSAIREKTLRRKSRRSASHRVARASAALLESQGTAAARAAALALRAELEATARGRQPRPAALAAAVRSLVETLDVRDVHADVAEVVCDALAAAAVHDAGPAALAEAGAAPALVAALGASSVAVVCSASIAIAAAAHVSTDFSAGILASNGAEALVSALRVRVDVWSAGGVIDGVASVCRALAAVAAHPDASPVLAGAGAMEVLAKLLLASVDAFGEGVASAVQLALLAVANLVVDDAALLAFLRAEGAAAVVTSLGRPGASVEFEAEAAAALCAISTRRAGACALGPVAARKAVGVLRTALSLDVLGDSRLRHEMLESSCWTLRNLTVLYDGVAHSVASAEAGGEGLLSALQAEPDFDSQLYAAHARAAYAALVSCRA